MAIKVYDADLHSERETIINALTRFLSMSSDDKRFEWLYVTNPHGQTRAWLAVDEVNNTVIGTAAAFPRQFYLGTSEVLGWILGDFCLDTQYRSLGPALQLQRACLGVLATSQAGFCCDFPSASMVAVYERLGFSMTGKMLRLAKPLRVDRKVKEVIKNSAAQRIATSIGNTFLKMASPKGTADETLEISNQKGPCDEEFTALMHEQRGRLGICLQRSAEYLNWRYVDNPLVPYEVITARKHGSLKGYAVWTEAGEDASIVDLFGDDQCGMMGRLVAEIAALARNRGVMTLSVSINESHPWRSLFCELGFRLRDSVPMVIIPSKTFAGKIDPHLIGWYLMQGDRDS